MTLQVEAPDNPLLDSAARLRAKERLYVALQSLGWGATLLVQLVFNFLLSAKADRYLIVPAAVQVSAVGLLLTHYGRAFIARRSWKTLDWRALVPRVLLTTAVLSFIWCVILILIQFTLLGWPVPKRLSLGMLFTISWVNCSIIAFCWLCVYFSYHVFDRFNRMEVDRLRMTTTIKQAELRALKSQLNPHFIFNSLNSLRALIDEDPVRARQAVTQLANLLRYSLQSVQLETVPFEDELRVVTDYLSLEQVRHEERLRLRLDVPIDALQWPIPPLLLQTLVENAVKYGVSTRPEGGEIGIEARCNQQVMTLRVTNPGQLSSTQPKNRSTGLGLVNAGERLRLLFGEKSSLQLRADGADCVVAEAIIPLQPSKN